MKGLILILALFSLVKINAQCAGEQPIGLYSVPYEEGVPSLFWTREIGADYEVIFVPANSPAPDESATGTPAPSGYLIASDTACDEIYKFFVRAHCEEGSSNWSAASYFSRSCNLILDRQVCDNQNDGTEQAPLNFNEEAFLSIMPPATTSSLIIRPKPRRRPALTRFLNSTQ